MEIAILILIHLLYWSRVIRNIVDGRAAILSSSALLVLLCWQNNSTWGIWTLVYTSLIFIILITFKTD